jgi:hypothetical protein
MLIKYFSWDGNEFKTQPSTNHLYGMRDWRQDDFVNFANNSIEILFPARMIVNI